MLADGGRSHDPNGALDRRDAAALAGLTMLIERDAVTSVWCFFAAILSVQTVLALEKDRHVSAERQAAA